MRVCTIATRSRLAQARTLGESLREHHPNGRLAVLVVDDLDGEGDDEVFEPIRASDLDLAPEEFRRMAAMYGPLQLCCALKPWLLLHLLVEDATVLYLDADTEVFAPLSGLGALADRHSLVLTPHLTEPPPRGLVPDEEAARFLSGSFNAGFVGVSARARGFLDWWRERLSRDCVHRPQQGYFDDQRWLDLAPTYFEHHVVRNQACNVGFWNVPSRPLLWDGSTYRVRGRPLRFFHFGGFDVERPHLLSRWLGTRPHTLLSENPALARLCRGYAERVLGHGYERCSSTPYGFGACDDGNAIDEEMRSAYRAGVLAAELGHEPEPPNPLREGLAFRSWLAAREHGSVSPSQGPPLRMIRQHTRRMGGTVGMSRTNERAYCHWYGLRLHTGRGEIVDLGCWLGSLTSALAMGLRDNPRQAVRGRRVHAYDAFRWTPQMTGEPAARSLGRRYRPGESFRDAFEARTAPWRDLIEVHEENLEQALWDEGEIEFLLVGAMKSWRLARGIAGVFFRHLVPGSLVLHQDFAHFATYWIHLLNYRLRDCFELEYDIPWASGVVLRVTKTIPEELLEGDLSPERFDAAEIDAAFEHAYALTSDRKQPEVAAAKVMALLDRGELERARDELGRWLRYRRPPSTDLPLVARVLEGRCASV